VERYLYVEMTILYTL